jgi:hypothetical protein
MENIDSSMLAEALLKLPKEKLAEILNLITQSSQQSTQGTTQQEKQEKIQQRAQEIPREASAVDERIYKEISVNVDIGPENLKDLRENGAHALVKHIIQEGLQEKLPIIVLLYAKVRFWRHLYENMPEYTIMAFRTENPTNRDFIATSRNDLENVLKQEIDELVTRIESFAGEASGWNFEEFVDFKVKYYKPVHPFSNGKQYIETPDWLKAKKAIVNIRNKDELCFKKCMHVSCV